MVRLLIFIAIGLVSFLIVAVPGYFLIPKKDAAHQSELLAPGAEEPTPEHGAEAPGAAHEAPAEAHDSAVHAEAPAAEGHGPPPAHEAPAPEHKAEAAHGSGH